MYKVAEALSVLLGTAQATGLTFSGAQTAVFLPAHILQVSSLPQAFEVHAPLLVTPVLCKGSESFSFLHDLQFVVVLLSLLRLQCVLHP